jgi:protein TonB
MPAGDRIVDVVFDDRRSSGRALWVVAGVVALGLHVSLLAWARGRGASLQEWSAELALRIHAELSRQDVIEVAAPNPPPPPPPPEVHPPPTVRAPAARSVRPPPPARAGSIVARETRPDAPVDLTGDTFVVGNSKAYAGGVTTSAGTNPVAVHTGVVDPGAPPTRNPVEPDLSSPVKLEGDEWQCAWPREADSAEINQQAVLLRVIVNPSGAVESATLLSDPGFGFGLAAAACAMHTHFEPARDRSGRAVRAASPPIRVRFTR